MRTTALIMTCILGLWHSDARADNSTIEITCDHSVCCQSKHDPVNTPENVVTTFNVPAGAQVSVTSRDDEPVPCVATPCTVTTKAQVFQSAGLAFEVTKDGARSPRYQLAGVPLCVDGRENDWAAAMSPDSEIAISAARYNGVAETAFLQDASQSLEELFTILGEIALKRARQKGARFLMKKIRDTICTKEIKPHLPRTCDLLTNMRLTNLAAAGESARRAVRGDLVDLVLNRAKVELEAEHIAAVTPLLGDLFREVAEGRASVQTGYRLLGHILEIQWRATTTPPSLGSCIAQGAVVVARQCILKFQRDDGVGICDTAHLAHQLLRAEMEGSMKGCTADQLRPKIAELERLSHEAAVILKELNSYEEANPTRALRSAVRLTISLVASLSDLNADARTKLKRLQATMDAMLDGDVPRLLAIVAAELASRSIKTDALAKPLAVLNTAIAYIEAPSKGEDAAAARKARTEAIEALMDEAASREGRNGDFIVSLGANVGVSAVGYERRLADDTEGYYALQVALPMGVALQRMPGGDDCPWHFGFFVVDLGQFVAATSSGKRNETRWDSGFGFIGQIGWVIGSAENPFVLGGEVRYAPTMFTDGDAGGAVRIGVFAQYYVPFFDFN